MGTTALPNDEFFRFLVNEGVIGEATIPSGTDRMAYVRAQIAAGLVKQADVDAARERFISKRAVTQATVAAGAAVAAADPLVGTTLGGCKLEALLGQGGMGAVYLATQLSLERRVAVKVQKEMAIPELIDRFRTEAKTLGRLHSAHIVDVYEVGTENGIPWFVMEYMPGGSLTGYVKKQPGGLLSHADAARLLLESCQGLAEAERHGVLHRDIKPDNLLLDGNGTLKIADFGIAKIVHEDPGLTATGFSPGTPAFKSPEQVAATPLDFRTDMYSLGLSFWALITGQRPRDVVTRQAVLEAVGSDLPWSSPELADAKGEPLLEVICRMMALKREDRFASWQELIDVLRSLPAGGTVPRPGKPAKSAAPRAAAAAAVLVLGLGAWWAWPRDDAPNGPPANGSTPASPPAAGERREVATNSQSPANGTTNETEKPNGSASPQQPQEPDARPPAQAPVHVPPSNTPDADAATRSLFVAELGQPPPTTPRSAADVRTAASNLAARATGLGLGDDARYVEVKQRLEREVEAAVVRDELSAVSTLAQFDQLAKLRERAAGIELAHYRDSATTHLDQLERDRPRFLRLSAADQQWLASWATWPLTDADTVELGGRFLPATITDTRRAGCRMVLLWSADLPPVYLDATEVTIAQWPPAELPKDLEGATDGEQPIRNVDPAAIATFLTTSSLRMPTLAEFTFALETRSGDRSWWGNTNAPPAGFARINVADKTRRKQVATAPYLPDHDDDVAGLAAAADPRFVQGRAGKFHHLLGNVAEWVTENGSPVVIGGSYTTSSWETFECRHRQTVLGTKKRQDVGFRAARNVPVR